VGTMDKLFDGSDAHLMPANVSQVEEMLERAVRTLAAIDNALGIEDDGCADPERRDRVYWRLTAEMRGSASRLPARLICSATQTERAV